MHTALHDCAGLHFGGLDRELQRVADDVSDAVEDLRRLIVMREDNGISLSLELGDFLSEIETKVYTAAYHRLISPD